MSDRVTVATVTVNPTIDIGLEVEVLTRDHKMRATASRREPGGGGVNVARSLHRLGTVCEAVITSGGATGAELERLLRVEGVATRALPIEGFTRESVSLTESSSGAQYRVVVDGPELSLDSLDLVIEAVGTPEIVVLSGWPNPGLPDDAYLRLSEQFRSSMVVIDCAIPALSHVMRGTATLVKPSARELSDLVGRALTTRDEIAAAASEALGWGGVGAMLVSLGADGALLVERDRPARWFEPPTIPRVVSTIGCGDAMVAGTVRALELGRPLEVAVGFGVAAGTAAATTAGTELFDPAAARALETRMKPPISL